MTLLKPQSASSSSALTLHWLPISLRARAYTPCKTFFLSLLLWPLFLPCSFLPTSASWIPCCFTYFPGVLHPQDIIRGVASSAWEVSPNTCLATYLISFKFLLRCYLLSEANLPYYLISQSVSLPCSTTFLYGTYQLLMPTVWLIMPLECRPAKEKWWPLFHSRTYHMGLGKGLAHCRYSINICIMLNK